MDSRPLTPTCALHLYQGDLTRVAVDGIVNAANRLLLGGGGIDGAIHRAAGPELLEACRDLPEVDGIRCPIGQARLTPGFRLPARYVIHTVGPVYARHPDPPQALADAHRNSLDLARAHGLRSVAFPAISCGVYGYPPEDAAPIALRTCRDHAEGLDAIHFVLFSRDLLELWLDAADDLLGPSAPP